MALLDVTQQIAPLSREQQLVKLIAGLKHLNGRKITNVTPFFDFGIGKLRDAFQKLLNSVQNAFQQTIQNAENAANDVLTNALRDTEILIQNAEQAYQTELDKTMSAISTLAAQTLGELGTIVDEISTDLDSTVAKIGELSKQIIALLVGKTIITSRAPYYVSSKSQNFMLTFNGNFPDVNKSGYATRLIFNNETFTPVDDCTISQITFNVSLAALKNGDDACQFTTGQLFIEYEDKGWIFNGKGVNEYSVGMGVLDSPGTLTALYSTIVTQVNTLSQDFLVKGNSTTPQFEMPIRPTPGYVFDPNTSELVIQPDFKNSQPGYYHAQIFRPWAQANLVQYDFKFEGGTTDTKVRIRCNEVMKTLSAEPNHEEVLDMNWGDSKVLPLSRSDGSVLKAFRFSKYTGETKEYIANVPITDDNVLSSKVSADGQVEVAINLPSFISTEAVLSDEVK